MERQLASGKGIDQFRNAYMNNFGIGDVVQVAETNYIIEVGPDEPWLKTGNKPGGPAGRYIDSDAPWSVFRKQNIGQTATG
jgi:hypothetical protein